MDQTIHNDLHTYLQNATEEETAVLKLILEGLRRKQDGKNGSYLGGLLRAKSNFMEQEQQLEMVIPANPIIQNSLNIVHGGITATLIDSAMGTLVHRVLPSDQFAVTSELKINYVAPGVGNEFKCIASIIHKGSKTVVCEGRVFRDDGALIAHSTASFFIIKRKNQ
ncbi:PaaI family thioesterase [Bacillus pinisoli]|uniref:PaaI family thioesterase n=1 Tax=Bacillus pinisoli TaxID=2901866 RepID=UPI001FF2BE18|nr:PaaI family thioesterase [Bacillus pinisoli]